MITIHQDAECMANILPAVPVRAEKRFFAFQDAISAPAALSLSQTGTLTLVIEQDGVPVSHNFSKQLGILNFVTAFDARQGEGGNLSIAIAADSGDGGSSSLHLICDVAPGQLVDLDPQSDAIQSAVGVSYVHDVFILVNGNSLSCSWPSNLATKSPKKSSLALSTSSNRVVEMSSFLDTTWKLATNPQKLIAVTFGTCRIGQGAFVLYQTPSGAVKLQFRTFCGKGFQAEPRCPSGATCLTSFVHPKTGYSVLLVGGTTVTSFTTQQYTSATSAGTTIIGASQTTPLKSMHASAAGSSVNIWYTTAEDSAYNYMADADTLASGSLVPILAAGHGCRMSGLVTAKPSASSSASGADSTVLVKTVLFADHSSDSLRLMQQASDTHLWRARPFYAASAAENFTVRGYTTRVEAVSDDSDERATIPGCQLHVVCSGYLRAIVNGKVATFSRGGDWYDADQAGALTIISEATDIASSIIHVDGFRPGPGTPPDRAETEPVFSVGTVDPTSKTLDRLREITTGKQLLEARLKTRDYLVQPGSITSDVAEKAARAISLFLEQVDGKTAHFSILDKLDLTSWVPFAWVEEKATEAANLVVDRVGEYDGVSFVVSIAEDTYSFVANTLETAKKGMSWVLSKIGVGIEKLIEFAGFVFNWPDVLNTVDNFAAYFNSSVDYCTERVDSLNVDIKAWLQQVRAAIKADRPSLEPFNNGKREIENSPVNEESHRIVFSVPFNWSSYQMMHGIVFASAATDEPTSKTPISILKHHSCQDSVLSDLWQLLVDQFQTVATLIENLADGLYQIFSSNNWTLEDVVSKITDDILNAALSSLENVVNAVLKTVSRIFGLFRQLANTEMEFPVITALWKFISGDRPLTLLNFFALILAIPTTVIYKLVMGKAPPLLAGRLTKNTLAKYIDGADISEDPTLGADMNQFAPAAVVVVQFVALQLWTINTALRYAQGSGTSTASPGKRVVISPSFALQSPSLHNQVLNKVQEMLDGSMLDLIEIFLRLPTNRHDRMDYLRWFVSTLEFIHSSHSSSLPSLRSIGGCLQ
ncbi:hypothetical protein B0T26DRAFT_644314 [Lasiosphaeria miniovina]|uniref:Uncharacterized protein n=1 Tax=Lasiosphaeria miniovina TaxID=1954250 RepID=A0AA40E1V9_9PEZI|nr:uncharacterized protein B0T26DRAFT_644314 [Lasiosphaeria miniovina]KAK0721897.1 hypothetical protein B0T26DRAFT_644314 [Lasiosphaeria miniovina]